MNTGTLLRYAPQAYAILAVSSEFCQTLHVKNAVVFLLNGGQF